MRYLARAGVASRRGADELIKAGRVTVNGEPGRAEHLRRRATASRSTAARVERQPLAYVLLPQAGGRRSRPRATRTGAPDRRRPRRPRRRGSSRSGRLDADTTGALLLTNDGELAHRLAHPRYGVEKVYVAEVEGEPSTRRSRALDARASSSRTASRRPPRAAPPRRRQPLELTLHEGRKHQVKRMLAAVGHPVHAAAPQPATRASTLEGLEPGAWRELEPGEVARLQSLT